MLFQVNQFSDAEARIFASQRGGNEKLADIAKDFENCVVREDNGRTPWGSAFYTEDENGLPKLVRENWDTSG